MAYSKLIEQLIETLRYLPGIGPRSAERIAFYILQRARNNGLALAKALQQAVSEIKQCCKCRNLSEESLCHICSNTHRDKTQLCIVENPADVEAVERTNSYKGLYFVLMGHLSSLDGLGPENIGIPALLELLRCGNFREVILATNPTIEGEATAYYILQAINVEFASRQIKCTRLAHGVPMGSELEYIDSNTLVRALTGRAEVGASSTAISFVRENVNEFANFK